MRDLVISRDAEADLTLIWVYIAENSPVAAETVSQSFSDTFDRLLTFPYLGRTREEVCPGLRSIPVGSYSIFYRVQESALEIVRVLHGAENVDSKFDLASDI